MALNITFRPLATLSATTLNKITNYLTKHSQNSGTGLDDLDTTFEHWASAIKFDEGKSLQTAIDDIIGIRIAPDTFPASQIIDADNPDETIDVHDITPTLSKYMNLVPPGGRLGITSGRYGLPASTTVFNSDIEYMGESRTETIIYTSGTVLASGGIMYLTNGTFCNMNFIGRHPRMLTIGRGGNVSFEDCIFDSFSYPMIRIEPGTTTRFSNCMFQGSESHGDSDPFIEFLNTPSDYEPKTYSTFNDCLFFSENASTFIRYIGYDNIPAAGFGNWRDVMDKVSKLRFLRCEFTYQNPLNSYYRAPIEVFSTSSTLILRMIVELIWCRIQSGNEYGLISDASMTNVLLSSFKNGNTLGSFNIRSGQSVASNELTINAPDLEITSDSAFIAGSTYDTAQYLAFRSAIPGTTNQHNIFWVDQKIINGGQSRLNLEHVDHSPSAKRKVYLSGQYTPWQRYYT